MAQADTTTRLPRGTKILSRAFFSAAEDIPESQRSAVVKAALGVIREELKTMREKTALAKAKAREKTGKPPVARGREAAGAIKALKKAVPVQAKPAMRRATKAAPKPATQQAPDASVETVVQS